MKKNFTLIELLVVVAIIGILAAMILPVLGRARDKAKQTQCKSNLKNIGTAIRVYYSDDHEGILPAVAADAIFDTNHTWVTTFGIDNAFLNCNATRTNNDNTYKSVLDTTTPITWANISVDYGTRLIQDTTTHEKDGKSNIMFIDGHVESLVP